MMEVLIQGQLHAAPILQQAGQVMDAAAEMHRIRARGRHNAGQNRRVDRGLRLPPRQPPLEKLPKLLLSLHVEERMVIASDISAQGTVPEVVSAGPQQGGVCLVVISQDVEGIRRRDAETGPPFGGGEMPLVMRTPVCLLPPTVDVLRTSLTNRIVG